MSSKSIYEMNEQELRDFIARNPNSMETRTTATALADAEQLLREMVEKKRSRSFESEDIIIPDPEKGV